MSRARRWFEEITSGRIRSSAEIARREGLRKGYVVRLTRLGFLSPTVVEAVMEGRTPAGLNLEMLMARRLILPLTWHDQERLLTIAQSSTKQSWTTRILQHVQRPPDDAISTILSGGDSGVGAQPSGSLNPSEAERSEILSLAGPKHPGLESVSS